MSQFDIVAFDPIVPALHEQTAMHLRDGSTVMAGPVREEDGTAVADFLVHLPDRDLPPAPGGRAAQAQSPDRRRTRASIPTHGALAAWTRVAGTPQMVALAWYVPRVSDCADGTLLVRPDWRRRGLGSALLGVLAHAAASEGFTSCRFTAPDGDADRLAVLGASGWPVQVVRREGRCHAELDLTPTDTSFSVAASREQASAAASLRPLLAPHSVAIIGASRDTHRLGRRLLEAVMRGGFSGPIIPVNPSAREIAGLPCHRSITSVPGPVDLAVVAVRAEAVPGVLAECGRAHVRAVAIITSGFAEKDADGRAAQDRLRDQALADGLRLIGPNCMGVLNTNQGVRLNASLASALPARGGAALTAQSGGIALGAMELAAHRGLGFSTVVSLGNRADVSPTDMLLYGAADPETSVLLLYLESFAAPRRFLRVARRVSRDKPVIALKSGRTHAGIRAASSHTAGLLAHDDAVDALFRQAGVMRVGTIDEMLDLALLLDTQPLPAGPRVTVLTNTGGPGILAADACEARGLELPALGDEAAAALAGFLPPHASVRNPVDLTAMADGQAYYRAVRCALASARTDALLVIYTEVDRARTVDVLAGIEKAVGRARGDGHDTAPVVACVLASGRDPLPLHAWDEKVPVYPCPEQAARALAHGLAHARWRNAPVGSYRTLAPARIHAVRALCRDAIDARGATWLTVDELVTAFAALDWPFVGQVARTADDACAHAAAYGYPVAVKAVLPGAMHKAEAGAVHLHLHDESAVRAAFEALTVARMAPGPSQCDAVLVQPMVLEGLEVFAGLRQEPGFGPIVGVGTGGTAVECLQDVSFALCPVTDVESRDLVHRARGAARFEATAHRPAFDVAALERWLTELSQLGSSVPEMLDVDLNPVMVMPEGQGIRLVDARVRVGPPAAC